MTVDTALLISLSCILDSEPPLVLSNRHGGKLSISFCCSALSSSARILFRTRHNRCRSLSLALLSSISFSRPSGPNVTHPLRLSASRTLPIIHRFFSQQILSAIQHHYFAQRTPGPYSLQQHPTLTQMMKENIGFANHTPTANGTINPRILTVDWGP